MNANADHNLITRCRDGSEKTHCKIPDHRQVMRLAKATGNRLPVVIRGVSSIPGRVAGGRYKQLSKT